MRDVFFPLRGAEIYRDICRVRASVVRLSARRRVSCVARVSGPLAPFWESFWITLSPTRGGTSSLSACRQIHLLQTEARSSGLANRNVLRLRFVEPWRRSLQGTRVNSGRDKVSDFIGRPQQRVPRCCYGRRLRIASAARCECQCQFFGTLKGG